MIEQSAADRVILETTENFGSYPPTLENMMEEMGRRESNVFRESLVYRNVTELDLLARLAHGWNESRVDGIRRLPQMKDVLFDMATI